MLEVSANTRSSLSESSTHCPLPMEVSTALVSYPGSLRFVACAALFSSRFLLAVAFRFPPTRPANGPDLHPRSGRLAVAATVIAYRVYAEWTAPGTSSFAVFG